MIPKKNLLLSIAILTTTALMAADEIPVIPQVESVALFKNGLCVVHSHFEAKLPGVYRWEKPPRAVYATFKVDSENPVTIQSTTRLVEEKQSLEQPTGNLQRDLAGRNVRLILKGVVGAIEGKVWDIPTLSAEPKHFDQINELDAYGRPYGRNALPPVHPAPATGTYLVIESEGTRQYVDISMIELVQTKDAAKVAVEKKERPVLLFNVEKPGPINVSYLTKGLSWMPSYSVDLTDPKKLKLRQNAVIKNELMPIKETELRLISGYPNVSYSHVDSPLWQGSTLTSFFQQLSQDPSSAHSRNSNMSQQAYQNTSASADMSLPLLAVPAEGNGSEDLHYENIGKRDLAEGDALTLDVANGEADYKRVVEWTVPDKRDEFGQYARRNDAIDDNDDTPWDAVAFANPLKYAMTTAAASLYENGNFLGQSQSLWTNPGQRACLRITRALSLQTNQQETEVQGSRKEEVWIGGNRYYTVKVDGLLTLKNFSSKPLTLLVRRQFSGRLESAEDKPSQTLRKEGVYSVNPRYELEWNFTLPAAEEKKLPYSYMVLVRN